MKKACSIPLCSILILLFLSHGVSQSLQKQEQSVLLKLKQKWGNLPYTSQWMPSTNSSSSHCSWPGINCQSNSVTGLNLYDANITTPVPSFICELKNLTDLNLGYNCIPGEFPRALYNCSKLEYLDLSDNCFVGTIPSDINRMVQLRNLSLGGNNFSGNIPPVIGQLQQLRSLNLGANHFNGSLPPELGDLFNLDLLSLSHNGNLQPSTLPSNYTQLKKLKNLWIANSNLIGGIPESIGEMTALENLDLSNNNLSGKIPNGLFKLKNLSIVFLHKNNLSGEIPQVVESLNLVIIDVSENNLTGRIPQDFAKLNKLSGLALFMNQLSGNIPEGLGRLPGLIDFSLFINNLSGVLPPDLGKYSNLRSFEVSSNRLEGKLPEQLCSKGKLSDIAAYDNNLIGKLPEGLGNCSSLTTVKIYNNKLSGNVPSRLWTSLNLNTLMLGNNEFTGVLPEKLAWNLSRVEINDNKFSGNIPTGSSSWKNLMVFKAGNNHLTGSIPWELTELELLTTLSLDQNQLTGDLPSHIQSWKSLNFLNLTRNQLSGQIPAELSLLPNLNYLDLSENQLSGQIPSQLGQSNIIMSLNLSSNKLTGTIPLAFQNGAYADSFLDNPGLCTSSNNLKLKPCPSQPRKRDDISTRHLLLIITLGTVIFLSAVYLSFFIIRGHWSKNGLESKWKLTSFQRLSFTESKIVSGLNDHNLIGAGGSGKVYRVPVNRQGDAVAVKKIWNDKKLDHKLEQEFLAEVEILSSIRHSNIVKLMCCISSESSKLLVYEIMENQSLDRWLHGKNNHRIVSASGSVHGISLDWPKRLQIAVGAAQGLAYMHHDCMPPVIHRDIKSSNILLDSEFNPKIADFGLAKLLVRQGELATMSNVIGSFGYMAPEFAHTVRVNEKIDVYSFGVVLLELATGREANNGGGREHSSLSGWAWRHVQEAKPIVEALDPEVEASDVEEMCWVFKVGIICTETLPSRRPSMKEVLQLLLRRRCPVMGYGEKFSMIECDGAPLLRNSKRETVLEGDNDDAALANIV